MHVLLEGVIPYELLLMLKYFVTDKKYFGAALLNDRISCFAYSDLEAKDRPSPIRVQILNPSSSGTLSQSCELYNCMVKSVLSCLTAAQMWALSINSPLIIGDKIPPTDEKWKCYLLLLDILQLCTTRVTSSGPWRHLFPITTNSLFNATLEQT